MSDDSGEPVLYGAAVPAVATKPLRTNALPAAAIPKLIENLEALLAHETDSLRRHVAIDLHDSNYKKSQALLDLTRGLRGFEKATMEPAIAAQIKCLSARLEENRAVLKMHMEAVREIAAIMADQMRDAESDGTYARPGPDAGQTI